MRRLLDASVKRLRRFDADATQDRRQGNKNPVQNHTQKLLRKFPLVLTVIVLSVDGTMYFRDTQLWMADGQLLGTNGPLSVTLKSPLWEVKSQTI